MDTASNLRAGMKQAGEDSRLLDFADSQCAELAESNRYALFGAQLDGSCATFRQAIMKLRRILRVDTE